MGVGLAQLAHPEARPGAPHHPGVNAAGAEARIRQAQAARNRLAGSYGKMSMISPLRTRSCISCQKATS